MVIEVFCKELLISCLLPLVETPSFFANVLISTRFIQPLFLVLPSQAALISSI